jgi:hypothetical protein
MARIFPDGWDTLRLSGGARREVETLALLKATLADTYTVYHGVHWTKLRSGFAVFGEADFIVVSPSGRLAVIEQKSGLLEETEGGLVKTYAAKQKNIAAQISRTVAGLHSRLTAAFGSNTYRIEELLYCPDYQVRNRAIAGVNPSRIVDASQRDKLAEIIEAMMPEHEAPLPSRDQIHGFLANELALVPDAGAMIGQAAKLVTRVSEGLASWARCIEFQPFRLRVVGTAGSGKTQLAIRVLEDAARMRLRALYVCYNRPLADHVRRIAPQDVTIMSFHQLCEAVATQAGVKVDFNDARAFHSLEQAFLSGTISEDLQFDVIIVDEGQDFIQAWVEPLERLLKAGGRWWWLEDPMQNLYRREAIALPGWVEVRATSNYRSPRDIVRFLGQLTSTPTAIEAASPFDGSDIGVISYPGASALQATRDALAEALALGFRPQDIAVLTFQGREKSVFPVLDQLGKHRLRSFTGHYDAAGTPLYRDGEILFDSVFRFKGQCAPCVILTEIDFEVLDEAALKRLFVGATRATMKLMLVISERAAGEVIGRL